MLALNRSVDDAVMTCPIDLYTLDDILEMMENYLFGDNTILNNDPEISSAFVNLKNIVDKKFSECCVPDSIADIGEAVVIAFPDP